MMRSPPNSSYVSAEQFESARAFVSRYTHHTPLLTSAQLNEVTSSDVYLKAEIFQRTGSYKIRGALNKIRLLSNEQRELIQRLNEIVWRHLLFGWQPRARCGAGGRPAGRESNRGHGRKRHAEQGGRHQGLRRGSHSSRRDLGRGERGSETARCGTRIHLRPSVRRPRTDRRPGDSWTRGGGGSIRHRGRRGANRRGWVDLWRVSSGEAAAAGRTRHRGRVERRSRDVRERPRRASRNARRRRHTR